MTALFDNDVLLKGACYGVPHQWLAHTFGPWDARCLGAAKFVLAGALGRRPPRCGAARAMARLGVYIAAAPPIETSDAERRLAADLESIAQTEGLSFDAGESQLLAVLVTRGFAAMVTGDKRAIRAVERLLYKSAALRGAAAGRLVCIEQLARALVPGFHSQLAAAVCSEPEVDKALSVCFSCHGPAPARRGQASAALASYIAHLRAHAATALWP